MTCLDFCSLSERVSDEPILMSPSQVFSASSQAIWICIKQEKIVFLNKYVRQSAESGSLLFTDV